MPLAVVLKLAGVLGQLVSEVGVVALVLVSTVSEAQLVTLVHKPVTCTQYWAASLAWTEAMEYLETAMSDPNAAMFTVFHWRHGFKEDWKEEGNGMDHPS